MISRKKRTSWGIAAAITTGAMVVLAGVSPAVAAPEDYRLDTSFTPRIGVYAKAQSMTVQSDGKILTAGNFLMTPSRWFVRFNADASPDVAFNDNLGTGFDSTVSVSMVQPDKKILVGGWFNSLNEAPAKGLARLNPDGTHDRTFTVELGDYVEQWENVNRARVNAIAVQPNGKIIIGGLFESVNGVPTSMIARLNVDGSLDTTFADAVRSQVGGEVYSIALQPDGAILIGTFFSDSNRDHTGLMRLNADGTLDAAFNTTYNTVYNASAITTVTSIAVLPNGQILVAGSRQGALSANKPVLGRLNKDGSPDAAFNSKVGGSFGKGNVYSMTTQANGKIVVTGNFSSTTTPAAVADGFARMNADGSPDKKFNALGFGYPTGASFAAVERGGAILVSGSPYDTLNAFTRFVRDAS